MVSHIQNQLGVLLRQLHTENTELTSVVKFADQVLGIAVSVDKLADKLWHLYGDLPTNQNYTSKLDEELGESEEGEVEEGSMGERVFDSEELRNYTAPKPNQQSGKKNFLGVEALYPSIGLPCIGVASSIDHYMTYKTNGVCPDDWVVAEKLIVGGCDPLPRRRCFSRSPQRYSKPLPINSSLWITPAGTNILWTHYKCKDYSCLISNQTVRRRGFFKCSDCFNLSKRGWEVPSNVTASAEFTINEVLSLKPGEIRIGLDFSPTTGTFAAIMRERNVTIASATLNLGAPFNEVIALRGLLPLYVSVGSRLPFFDNTLIWRYSSMFCLIGIALFGQKGSFG
ncbi:hypothetical protein IFM89_011704 [Coptis chinensis]|uniref:Uncharacterized protein n=1 Tax=Coptis chinensis TaxID=261450 RepID=A0A835ISY3_9MAGN|nr:hypothetical protein IFM89_011704 [Coptis chinensis]